MATAEAVTSCLKGAIFQFPQEGGESNGLHVAFSSSSQNKGCCEGHTLLDSNQTEIPTAVTY